MSWVILFAWTYSSCKEREVSKIYKIKNPCPRIEITDPPFKKYTHNEILHENLASGNYMSVLFILTYITW